MKKLGDLLAILGIALFIYTIIARFVGEKSILGLSNVPVVGEYLDKGFSAVGMFSGIACLLLIAAVLILKSKK
ncbi:MAG: hypothetical protein HQ594_05955 [Candidatus Omnitrophica bacterium]|nr:hypothetical protein [Candidatus Omnitrophota bacterium]